MCYYLRKNFDVEVDLKKMNWNLIWIWNELLPDFIG